MEVNQKIVTEDEIDLLALAQKLWAKRYFILKVTGIFILLGLFIAIFSPNEFTAGSTFVPQTSQGAKPGGSLGGLASLAGIDLSGMGGGSEIPPMLYPKIVNSVSFRLALLEAPVTLPETGEKVTYRQYYTEYFSPSLLSSIKKYTIGMPGVIIKAIKGDPALEDGVKEVPFIKVSPEDYELLKQLPDHLEVNPNDKEGIVSLNFSMPDPLMAAEMAAYAEQLLQKELIAYKVKNAQEQLRFTEEQLKEKEKAYEAAQARLANFRDRNQSLTTAASQNELQRLEANFNIAFNVYNELAKQYEQAKLQVSKDTPVFSVIEPVNIPNEKSSPNRPLIIMVFGLVGIIICCTYLLFNDLLKISVS